MSSAEPLAAPVALVTGSSRGIGLATARLLAMRGYRVLITGRDGASLSTAEADLLASGLQACACAADLADPAAIDQLMAVIQARFGGLDVLVNNAGGSHHARSFASLSPEDWDHTLLQNLTTTARVSRAALPLLKRSKAAAIVNVASKAGRHRTDMAACDYVAAKAGLIGLTRQLAQELAPLGIRVNAIAPGITTTPRVERRWEQRGPELRNQILAGIPLGRLAAPEEIAEAIVFMASSASSYITGATLDVNGGAFMG
jgi:NAD(P)-dependent dehydrogenase (short-subunit alcohol dehydrogenase family)